MILFFSKVKKLTRIKHNKVFSRYLFWYLGLQYKTLNCILGLSCLLFCKEDKKGQKEPHGRSLNTHTNGARGRKSLLLCRTARPSSRVPSSSKSSTTGAPSAAAAAADKIITVIHTRIPRTTNVIMRKEKRECEDLHLDLLQRLSRRRRILTTLKREERREWSKTPPCS